jgi:spermidine/putrescine transport system substrate-binding protein
VTRHLTRRRFLRWAGAGVAGIGLGRLLTACGGEAAGPGPKEIDPAELFAGEPEGSVNFANWPLYIDKTKDPESGERYSPSLRAFTEETGNDVVYKEIIQENASFFGKLQPQLAAGQSTGWDIIVLTNGWELTAMIVNDWALPLDPAKRPNFDEYAASFARDPVFDPGNRHTMAWQAGITGVAVNHDLIRGEVARLDDLADPAKVGHDRVGMIKADMGDFVMINLGIDPVTSTPEDWKEAAAWLLYQRDRGVVRQYYEQGYADDMAAGNLSATMAWSGDVLYYRVWSGYDHLEFIGPSPGGFEGELLWIDNMLIPAGAEHPVAAYQLMDFVYRPEIATGIQEWVLYMSPCSGTRQELLNKAEEAEEEGWKIYARKLRETAENAFLFPSDELLGRVSHMRQLTSDEEKEEWDAIFEPITAF